MKRKYPIIQLAYTPMDRTDERLALFKSTPPRLQESSQVKCGQLSYIPTIVNTPKICHILKKKNLSY